MSIAQHAERILVAWQDANPEQFDWELENASRCCERGQAVSIFEIEQRELLQSIVECLRHRQNNLSSSRSAGSQGLTAGFALLQHLRHSDAA